MGAVPTGPPPPRVEVLEGGVEPGRWLRRWAGLPPAGRRLVAAAVVLVVLGVGVVWVRDHIGERELRERVAVTTSLEVWSSSTSRPGGEVGFSALLRNDGPLPVSVTALEAGTDGLRLRMHDAGDRRIEPGREIEVPLSVRLTCGVAGAGPAGLGGEIRLRRVDGGSTVRAVTLRPAEAVLDIAATLCGVRPELRDHELSGPVLRSARSGGGRGE